MNEKILNNRELAQVKRIAQNVDANYQKVLKLDDKIQILVNEREALQEEIDEMEAPVVRKTGGYKSTDIFEKVIVPQFNDNGSPKLDKEGRQVKVTKYVLKYEDGVLPVRASEASISPKEQNNLNTNGKIVNTKEAEENSLYSLDPSMSAFVVEAPKDPWVLNDTPDSPLSA